MNKSFDLERMEVRGFTIDGPESLDLDDAIWIEEKDGCFAVHVTIADVQAAINRDSVMDKAAGTQVFTRYFARGNHPMLPRHLAENELSLHAGKPRRTITAFITLLPDLTPGEVIVRRTWLLSQARLSYEGANSILADPTHELHQPLQTCATIARGLLQSRRDRGAFAVFDLLHGWATTEEGFLSKLLAAEAHIGNIIVQEFMILANWALANYCAENRRPILFRNHLASPVGSKREKIFQDLMQATAHPETFDPAIVQARIGVVLNRANYGPQAEGHFGLNLPVYTHMTSPLRRYPDLVNQRIVSALLAGQESPYTPAELETIAAQVNSVEGAIKDAEKQGFKVRAYKRADRQLGQGGFSVIDQDGFHLILASACRQSRLTAELKEEINARLRNETLPIRDAFMLLFESGKDQAGWEELRAEALSWVYRHRPRAVTLLMMGKDLLKWAVPRFSTTTEEAGFVTVAQLVVEEKEMVSIRCIANSKKASAQAAAVDLIRQLVGGEAALTAPPASEPPQPQPIFPVNAPPLTLPCVNSKGRLLEICQKRHWPRPSFQSCHSGLSHRPIFEAVAGITVAGIYYQSDKAQATVKTEAEQLAAADLLDKLGAAGLLLEESLLPGQGAANTNAVSALQEFCVKKRWTLPQYATTMSGPPHIPTVSCACTVTVPAGAVVVHMSQGPNSKVAKQAAAALVLHDLLQKENLS